MRFKFMFPCIVATTFAYFLLRFALLHFERSSSSSYKTSNSLHAGIPSSNNKAVVVRSERFTCRPALAAGQCDGRPYRIDELAARSSLTTCAHRRRSMTSAIIDHDHRHYRYQLDSFIIPARPRHRIPTPTTTGRQRTFIVSRDYDLRTTIA